MLEKTKRDLRTEFLKKRKLVKNKINKEKKIVKKLKDIINYNGLVTAVYYSTKSEVFFVDLHAYGKQSRLGLLLTL